MQTLRQRFASVKRSRELSHEKYKEHENINGDIQYMKRNFDLIRKIILDIQSLPANTQDACLEYTGEYSQDDVNEHVAILIEAGLVKGKPIRAMGGIIEVSVQSLTWEGHNFAEIAENNVLWKKAISTINEKGGTITFEVLKSLLGSLALKAAGLA